MTSKRKFTFTLEHLRPDDGETSTAIWHQNFIKFRDRMFRDILRSSHFYIASAVVYLGLSTIHRLFHEQSLWTHVLFAVTGLSSQWIYTKACLNRLGGTPDLYDPYSYWSGQPDTRRFINARCSETGEIAGTIAVKRKSTEDPVAELVRLRVLPKYVGNRLGTILTQKCEEIAREWGCTEMFLDTIKDHEHALKLYERYGFKEVGQPVYFQPYPGLKFHDIIYSMPLRARV